VEDDIYHAYHLYVVRIKNGKRDDVFKFLRDKNIGVNVHYIPVHLHPYYTTIYGSLKGLCYNAETVYKEIITLPIYPQLSDEEQQFVIDMVTEAVKNI
jgi:dTDP-4-amino-4,6-dideoxygalactose transaminase